jgi:hypothetical protein
MKSTKRSFKDLSPEQQQQVREEGRRKREEDRLVRDTAKANEEVGSLEGEMHKFIL